MNNALDKVLTPIVERLAQELETYESTGVFRIPYEIQFPRNAHTNQPYNGINILRLSVERRSSPVWATFNQWNTLGYRIRKGSHGAAIYSPPLYAKKTDDFGTIILNARPPRAYYVYNSDDVHLADNPDVSYVYDDSTVNPDDAHTDYEAFFSSIPYKMQLSDKASYSMTLDLIRMPARELFINNTVYYSTLAHEVIHWTGHQSRLSRPMKTFHKDLEGYAEEELVAEFGAALVCAYLKIPYDELRTDHLEYLSSWSKAIKKDTAVIRRAMTAAIEAFQHVKSYQQVDEEIVQE